MADARSFITCNDPLFTYHQVEEPEHILSFYDAATGMRAIVAIDATAFGLSAGGARVGNRRGCIAQ